MFSYKQQWGQCYCTMLLTYCILTYCLGKKLCKLFFPWFFVFENQTLIYLSKINKWHENVYINCNNRYMYTGHVCILLFIVCVMGPEKAGCAAIGWERCLSACLHLLCRTSCTCTAGTDRQTDGSPPDRPHNVIDTKNRQQELASNGFLLFPNPTGKLWTLYFEHFCIIITSLKY